MIASTAPPRPLVSLSGVHKQYPGVRALDDIDVDILPGEIHAIVGENGAGKSTLVRLLSGLETPTSGSILVQGVPVRLRNPAAARRAGVSVVPQETNMVSNLNVGRNLLLGRERRWTNRTRLSTGERKIVLDALARMGIGSLAPECPASSLNVAERRLCQIAATLTDPGRLLILDEPTAVLSDADAEVLLERLAGLREHGTGILYISHRLGEVMRLADRISVLRDGRCVGTYRRDEIDRGTVLDLMAQRQDSQGTPEQSTAGVHPATADERVALRVDGLGRPDWFADVSFDVRAGEVVGIAGIQGSGHGRLLEVIAGAAAATTGTIEVGGRAIEAGVLASALGAGIRLVPEDRRERGIVGSRSIRENLSIGHGSAGQRSFIRRPSAERELAAGVISKMRVRAGSPEVRVANLSGGNQQKVVIARVLASAPKVLLLSEPTQGIDLRAKSEILATLRQVAQQDRIPVVVASSEFEELLDVADMVHVMRQGRLVATMPAASATYQEILAAAVP